MHASRPSSSLALVSLVCTLGLAACKEGEVSEFPEKRQPIPEDERPDLSGDEDDTGDPGGSDEGGGSDGGGGDSGSDGGDEGGSDGGGSDGGGSEPDPAEACHPDLEGWPASWASLEEQVVELVNDRRAKGADCGSYGTFGPADPVEMDPHLRCAARYHSLWMAEESAFSHDSPGGDLGDDPWERIDSTDFSGQATGENIAAGYSTAAKVVAGWVDSDGHCANLMAPNSRLTGVGYAEGHSAYGSTWTQNFGR